MRRPHRTAPDARALTGSTRRWHVAAALGGLALVVGCNLVPSAVTDPARGAGVARALAVHGAAVDIAERRADQAPPGCRTPLPARGPIEVATILRWVRKAPGVAAERYTMTVTFHRDASGDFARHEELELRLPDGRVTTRSREIRVAEGSSFAAIDGRFARADRLPGLAEQADEFAMGDVDDLLTLVALDDHGALVAASRRGLCGDRAPSGLPPVNFASVAWAQRGRRGWLRWNDSRQHISMVVTFDERVRAWDGDIAPPEHVWPVDPDRSFTEVGNFGAAGLVQGWLLPPRIGAPTPESGEPVTPDPEQP